MDILVVVDMQNDFVSGVLGTPEAVSIVPRVVSRVAEGIARGEKIFFTRDTHTEDYLNTQEGKKLPVPHCIRGSEGWEIIDQLKDYTVTCSTLNKPTFGGVALAEKLYALNENGRVGKITFIGLCTDICVISNVLLTKACLPEVEIAVDASCCAGVTPESHRTALAAMKACQVTVENEM